MPDQYAAALTEQLCQQDGAPLPLHGARPATLLAFLAIFILASLGFLPLLSSATGRTLHSVVVTLEGELRSANETAVLQGESPDAAEKANYFGEYAYMYQQMIMLEDGHRTGSYYNAMMWNPRFFEGKSVLDVGAGTGILSIIAAKAGATQVFAVEATDLAERTRKIVETNGLSNVITVIQGKMETVELPCKVDIIVSEWMGYFLLFESMLDPVLHARDKYLKPGGVLFPSHATLFLAPLGHAKQLQEKWNQWEAERNHWTNFYGEMKMMYDTDFIAVQPDFQREQRRYYLQTSAYATLNPAQMIGPGVPLWSADLLRLSLEDLQKNQTVPYNCSMKIVRDGPVGGFAGYFEVFFRGSTENPVDQAVTLTTAPVVGTATHWGQQIFGFFPPLQAKRGDILDGSIFIRRQVRNHRALKLETTFFLRGVEDGSVKEKREEIYYVE